MSKQEFMKELEALLAVLPAEEREEAIRYYDAYFEDAGAENEQAVINELGSADKVAAQLLRDFLAEKEAGVYTEKGYRQEEEAKEMPMRYHASDAADDAAQDTASQNAKDTARDARFEDAREKDRYRGATTDGSGIHIRKKGMSGGTLVLFLIVAVLAFPIWFPLLMAAAGVIFGLLAALAALVFGIGVGGVVCVFAGVVVLLAGFVKLAAIPIVGLAFLAAALLVFGVGCLLLVLAGAIFKLFLWLAGGCLSLCSRMFHGRREAAA